MKRVMKFQGRQVEQYTTGPEGEPVPHVEAGDVGEFDGQLAVVGNEDGVAMVEWRDGGWIPASWVPKP